MEDAQTEARLREFRERADGMDRETVCIRDERARLAQGIIDAKAGAGRPLFNPKRFTLDLSTLIVAKRITDLPVIVDPSHAADRCALVAASPKASVAAEADGSMIESHHEPQAALCDAGHALSVGVPASLRSFAETMGREVV